ncbi:MAG: type II toxin-antitoxin system Phd/YefM family antitoxin [Verrucomicrobiales bacterium]
MPETIVNIHEAKTHLSRLIERAEAGETVIIAKAGKPKVRLVSIPSQAPRKPGRFAGELKVDEAFFAPLSEADLRAWEGGGE